MPGLPFTRRGSYAPYHRGQVVVCPRCGGYRITIDALGVLTKLNIDRRLEALYNAKRVTLSRSWPTIDKAILVAANVKHATVGRDLLRERSGM